MKNIIVFVLVGLSAYFPRSTTDSETVWLKDVTGQFQAEKRTLSDPDLPDQLSFRIKGESHSLILNLQRNHEMDPNADIYIVRKLDDGRSHLVKTQNLETEDVAYYQDPENWAFVTARCVKRLNGQCDISINGNIRIGDINYDLQPSDDLQPSEGDMSSIDILEMMDLGKRYVLRYHSNIEKEMSVESKDEKNNNLKNVEEKLRDLLRVSYAEDKNNHFYPPDVTGSRRKFAGLQNKGSPGDDVSGINNNDGKLRNLVKTQYHVKTLVLADSSVWDLFLTTVDASVEITKREPKAQKNTRRYFSHIMNGVNQLYKGIGDPEIEINVYIRAFLIFPWLANFPHFLSKINDVNGTKTIDANLYLTDLGNWDLAPKELQLPDFDQVILFTRYEMFRGNITNVRIGGLSIGPHVCVPGYRVQIVRMGDFFWTLSTTAHELGHNLGADHDGEGDAKDCKAKDQFIMSPALPVFSKKKQYSRNPWLFSSCSVKAFKKTLKNKECVTKKPNFALNELDEYNKFISKMPGAKYSPSVQCHLINGPGSKHCGGDREHICRFMTCTDPKTDDCLHTSFSAAPGTICGLNKADTAVCQTASKRELETFQDFRVILEYTKLC